MYGWIECSKWLVRTGTSLSMILPEFYCKVYSSFALAVESPPDSVSTFFLVFELDGLYGHDSS